jgi:hypothetical protein
MGGEVGGEGEGGGGAVRDIVWCLHDMRLGFCVVGETGT